MPEFFPFAAGLLVLCAGLFSGWLAVGSFADTFSSLGTLSKPAGLFLTSVFVAGFSFCVTVAVRLFCYSFGGGHG